MEACVLVLRTRKPPARRNRILFVNAVLEVARRNAESFLEDAHRERILAAYRDDDPKPGFSRSVPVSEIEGKDWSLSIPLYVAPPAEAGGADAPCPPLPDALAAWEETRPALAESLAALDAWLEPADKEDAR
jgi:type I restriction enzyme M protein